MTSWWRLSPRRAAVLTVLCEAGEPLSTTEVRVLVNRGRQQPLVAEQVYGALVALALGGFVRRVPVAGSRKAFWQAVIEVSREEVV